MLGKRSIQAGLFDADAMYLDFVGRDSFYGFLATQRSCLFHDEDFADLSLQRGVGVAEGLDLGFSAHGWLKEELRNLGGGRRDNSSLRGRSV